MKKTQRSCNGREEITTHFCESFTDDLMVPEAWNTLVSCRACKQELTIFIAHLLLKLTPKTMRGMQEFVTNIGSTVYRVEANGSMFPVPYLWSNADEGDLRVWLHFTHATGRNTLIVSPDTDVYHIALTFPFNPDQSTVIVQLSKQGQSEKHYINVNSLLTALENDPYLHQVPPSVGPQMMQSLCRLWLCLLLLWLREGKIPSKLVPVCIVYCKRKRSSWINWTSYSQWRRSLPVFISQTCWLHIFSEAYLCICPRYTSISIPLHWKPCQQLGPPQKLDRE